MTTKLANEDVSKDYPRPGLLCKFANITRFDG